MHYLPPKRMSQPQLELEKYKFVIGLSGTYWDKIPRYSIWIDDKLIIKEYIQKDSDDVEYITFEESFLPDKEYTLKIRLENKHNTDTVLDDSNNILKDMLLNIESIMIDDIELEMLKWSQSIFLPDDSVRPILKECVNLGWNGSYILKFTVPFYLWLLENM